MLWDLPRHTTEQHMQEGGSWILPTTGTAGCAQHFPFWWDLRLLLEILYQL